MLQYVPVLDNRALIIEPKDINPCPVAIARPLLVAVQHNEVIVGQDSPEFDAFAGVLASQPFEVFDERTRSARCHVLRRTSALSAGHRKVPAVPHRQKPETEAQSRSNDSCPFRR